MSSRKWARVGRVTCLFTVVGLTYAGVKCAVSELRGTKQHDPVSSLVGGMAAGAVAMIPRGNPAHMAGCSLVFGVGSMLLAFQLEGSNSLMLYQTGKDIRGLRSGKSESQ